MFKKPLAHQGNATPIRSSARRQLLSSILEQYPALKVTGTIETQTASDSGDAENDTAQRDLGRLIVPEGVKTGSFETSGGVQGVCVVFEGLKAMDNPC